MSQIALPLATATGPERILLGESIQDVVDGFAAVERWPFRTAVLAGPARSGKSLLARYFAESGIGEAIDDADRMDEDALFHRWNRAQAHQRPLLLVSGRVPGAWTIVLPDLASRLGSALLLEIGPPDDSLVEALAIQHAARRGLVLGDGALAWLLPRIERSHAAIEQVIAAADRLSLERRHPVTISLLRDALADCGGGREPRLL
ncbi:MAG: ATPase [Novosphingobium sp.]